MQFTIYFFHQIYCNCLLHSWFSIYITFKILICYRIFTIFFYIISSNIFIMVFVILCFYEIYSVIHLIWNKFFTTFKPTIYNKISTDFFLSNFINILMIFQLKFWIKFQLIFWWYFKRLSNFLFIILNAISSIF